MNIDKLDDVMNEYNNTDRTIKWNLLMFSMAIILNTMFIQFSIKLKFKIENLQFKI